MTDRNVVHTYPVNDLVEHDTGGDTCICGPTTEAVFRDDGTSSTTASTDANTTNPTTTQTTAADAREDDQHDQTHRHDRG